MFNFPENQKVGRKDVITYLLGLATALFFILLMVLGSSLSANAQQTVAKSLKFKTAVPVTDHYHEYASIAAAGWSEALDTLSFPAHEFNGLII